MCICLANFCPYPRSFHSLEVLLLQEIVRDGFLFLWKPKVRTVKTPIIHQILKVHFQHADLPVGVVFHLVDVGEGVGEVLVACIGEGEVDNEEVAEVRPTRT